MPTQFNGTTGADGANGAEGADSPNVTTPAGDGGDATGGGSGGGITMSLTQAQVDAGHDYRTWGGRGGDGGMGGYSGDIFYDHHAVRTGDAEVQNDYFSAAGAGGDGGDGGDGANSTLSASGFTFNDGITLLSSGGYGGNGGAGRQGGTGATNIHNTVAVWQSYVDTDLNFHQVSLDYTSHGAPGGMGGKGGDGGDGGDGILTFGGNTVHGDVWLVAQGFGGGLSGQASGSGAGNNPAAGNVGGDGGAGGNGNLTIDNNHFDFASSITFTAWSGYGGPGGMGGSGGYGDDAEGVESVYVNDYSYAMGGVGGKGGDGGSSTAVITDNQFIGGDFTDILTLSINLYGGAGGAAGHGGVGALGATAYDAADGAKGSSGGSSLTFSGNVLDGEGGVDTLNLLMWNLSGEVSNTGAGVTPLPALDINLGTGTMMVGSGVNAIDDIENVSVSYVNGYYDSGNNLHRSGDVVLTGNGSDNILSTTYGNDRIDGGIGADDMRGGTGNDTYYVDNVGDVIREAFDGDTDTVHTSITWSLAGQYLENAILDGTGNIDINGNRFDNVLTGNSGNNRIDGFTGTDTMYGGGGNDTYVVDDATDIVSESLDGTNDDGGVDSVIARMDGFVLGNFFENLTLASGIASAVTGTGNGGNNILAGNGNDNVLYGLGGNDTLSGRAGADTMYGGSGNDTYVVDNSGDVASEQTVSGFDDGGTDTVNASVNYTLGTYLEILSLAGAGNINATGNSAKNSLVGNSGNNILTGLGGNDYLVGGAGSDTFAFGSAANNGTDQLADFVSGVDKLQFTGSDYLMEAGPLQEFRYTTTGTAVGTNAQFVYNPTTHTLMWDANGSNAGGITTLAVFLNNAVPLLGDFAIV